MSGLSHTQSFSQRDREKGPVDLDAPRNVGGVLDQSKFFEFFERTADARGRRPHHARQGVLRKVRHPSPAGSGVPYRASNIKVRASRFSGSLKSCAVSRCSMRMFWASMRAMKYAAKSSWARRSSTICGWGIARASVAVAAVACPDTKADPRGILLHKVAGPHPRDLGL